MIVTHFVRVDCHDDRDTPVIVFTFSMITITILPCSPPRRSRHPYHRVHDHHDHDIHFAVFTFVMSAMSPLHLPDEATSLRAAHRFDENNILLVSSFRRATSRFRFINHTPHQRILAAIIRRWNR
jgi:hypothetical protein